MIEHSSVQTSAADKPEKDTIDVVVQSGRGSRPFSFPKQTKIQEVINKAASELGYPAGGNYSLVRLKTNEELELQRTLVSYHIEDHEILALTETGSGA